MQDRPTLQTAFKTYRIRGLDCASCASRIEDSLRKYDQLKEASINYAAGKISVPSAQLDQVQSIISEVEPGVTIESEDHRVGDDSKAAGASRESAETDDRGPGDDGTEQSQNRLVKFAVTGMVLFLGFLFHPQLHATPYAVAEYVLLLSAYLYIGWPVLSGAVRNILRGRIFDEYFLMTIATAGAIAIHELPEALAVMLFYSVGEYFQDRAVNRTRRSVTALLEARPDYANLQGPGGLSRVSPESVDVGATIVVRPGERAPLDGEVVDGTGQVDTSAITGESVPRRYSAGDQLLAGMVCTDSVLTVRVTKPYGESSIARILELVESAAGRKAKTERFITTFSRYYTPVVVVAALLLAFVPPAIFAGASLNEWVYRAMVLLVISCPCALVISIPLSYFGGLGGASRHGILVKGANILDSLNNVHTVGFDKTGTLTEGVFQVTRVEVLDADRAREGLPPIGSDSPAAATLRSGDEMAVLRLAAMAEVHSSHPIADAIRKAVATPTDPARVTEYREVAGRGVSANVSGSTVLVGTEALMRENGVTIPGDAQVSMDLSATTVLVARDGNLVGGVSISDSIRPTSHDTIRDLRALGVSRTVMITGDQERVAESVAKAIGIDRYLAELLPEQKVEAVEELLRTAEGRLVFAGDGMNDAPVLARADVGVAMGGLGSDAAIEAADVVIMDDDPARLVTAIGISRRTKRIVLQNIVFALGIKVAFIVLGVLGIATMWGAVFADVGVTILAVLNSIRALTYRPRAITR